MGYAEICWPWRRSPTIQRSIVRLTTACLGIASVGDWSLSQGSISSMTLSVLGGRERLAWKYLRPSTPLKRRTITRMLALLLIWGVRWNESTRSMRWRGRHLLVNRIYVGCSGWNSARAVDRSVQTPEPVGPREGLLLEGELQVHYHE